MMRLSILPFLDPEQDLAEPLFLENRGMINPLHRAQYQLHAVVVNNKLAGNIALLLPIQMSPSWLIPATGRCRLRWLAGDLVKRDKVGMGSTFQNRSQPGAGKVQDVRLPGGDC